MALTAFRLTFPPDVKPDQAAQWVTAIAGLLRRPASQLFGLEVGVLEFVHTEDGIRHRLRLPDRHAAFVIGQLEGHLPGAHAIVDDHARLPTWRLAREYGTSSHRLPLRTANPETVSSTLLSAVGSDLRSNEAIVLQLVVTTARTERPGKKPRTVNGPWWLALAAGRHEPPGDKTADVNLLAVIRIAVAASSDRRARHLLRQMRAALDSASSQVCRIRPRWTLRPQAVVRRVTEASTPWRFPATLTAGELVALSGIPLGSPDIPGLPASRTRHMRPDPTLPRLGIVLARSTVPGRQRPIALAPMDFMRHVYLPGRQGAGKSTLLENVASQWMRLPERYGLTFVDPHGDAAENLLNLVPRERIADVIYCCPAEIEHPVGANPLEGESPGLVTSYLMGVLEQIFGVGILTADYLRNSIYTVALHGGQTLHEVVLVLDDALFRDSLTRGLQDENLRRFWTAYEAMSTAERTRTIEPVMRRLRPFLLPELRGIFGQAKGIDFKAVLDEGKILILNLAQARLGEGPAMLCGSLVIAKLWQEVLNRSAVPPDSRLPHLLVCDEFQKLIKLPISFGDMTAEARKFKLGLVLANQLMDQIRDIRTDVLANTFNKIVLSVVAADAAAIAREIGLREEDLKRLGKYEAVLSLTHDGHTARPATGVTLPPAEPVGLGNAVKLASRSQYGKPRAAVEAEIAARRQRPTASGRTRPKIGKED